MEPTRQEIEEDRIESFPVLTFNMRRVEESNPFHGQFERYLHGHVEKKFRKYMENRNYSQGDINRNIQNFRSCAKITLSSMTRASNDGYPLDIKAATYVINAEDGNMGWSYCRTMDEFNRYVGRYMAINRLAHMYIPVGKVGDNIVAPRYKIVYKEDIVYLFDVSLKKAPNNQLSIFALPDVRQILREYGEENY